MVCEEDEDVDATRVHVRVGALLFGRLSALGLMALYVLKMELANVCAMEDAGGSRVLGVHGHSSA